MDAKQKKIFIVLGFVIVFILGGGIGGFTGYNIARINYNRGGENTDYSGDFPGYQRQIEEITTDAIEGITGYKHDGRDFRNGIREDINDINTSTRKSSTELGQLRKTVDKSLLYNSEFADGIDELEKGITGLFDLSTELYQATGGNQQYTDDSNNRTDSN